MGLEFPGVDEDGRRRRRFGPVAKRSAVAVLSGEVLDAPEVLGAGEAAPVRDPAAERFARGDLRRHHAAAGVGACHVVRVMEERPRQRWRLGAVAGEAVDEVEPEGAEEVRHGRDAEPR